MQLTTFRVLAALSLGHLFLWAQNPTATLVGAARDASGSFVADAKLEVRNSDTGSIRKTVTDQRGEFTVPNLDPGPYEVTLSKEGFHTVHQKAVLELDQVARLEFKLEVGAVTQSVEVMGTAAPLINTENGSQGQVMTSQEIVEMPLNGRDFSNLAYLVPGVTQSDITIEGSGFAVNGARPDNTNFVIDGVADRDPRVGFVIAKPNLDALQEFKMETNNFSPEYGQLAGGVMNMVLKSGTNQFHGTLFEFLRNNAVDARNFFAQTNSEPELRQNQFGGVVTGPVSIPKVYNGHDRTFFLFSWESLREVNGTSTLGAVPTALQRQGNFSQLPISDPLSTGTCPGSAGKGGCFPGNVIPQSRMSPQAVAAGAYEPVPNVAGANNMAAYTVIPTDWNSWIMKFDERLSQRDNLSFRYSKTYTTDYSAFPNAAAANANNSGLFGANQHNHTTLTGLNYTHTFSPTIINVARIGFTRDNEHDISAYQGVDYNAKFGIPGLTTDPRLIGMPLIYVSGYQQIGPGVNFPVFYSINGFQYGDTFTWVKGAHLFKFGGDILHSQFNQPYWNNARGDFTFTGFWTGQPWADFLLGYLNGSSRQVGAISEYLRNTDYGFFFADDWKITSRLTLNLGLRYEIPKPPVEENGRESNFVPGLGLVISSAQGIANGVTFSNPKEVLTASQAGLPTALVDTRYNAWAPRFGFAWRPLGGSSLVVRGGYGIFYGAQTLNPIKNQMSAAFPFVISQSENRGATNPTTLTLANPFPDQPNLSGNLSTLTMVGWQVNAPVPYLQSWNFAIEKEIGFSSALKAAYVGSKGTHFGIQVNLNQPIDRSAALPAGLILYPGYGTINYFSFEDNSSYNGLTLTWQRRFVHHFFYTANYTYNKCLNNASNLNGAPTGGVNGLQNTYNLSADRGRCDWDIPHQFTMSFSWMSPSHNLFLRGWQFAGTSRLYSGSPFTPTVTNSNVALGQAIRPNRIAKGTVPNPSPSMWFDVADFPAVPSGAFAFGDAGRNILDAPGRIELNASFNKNFYVTERTHLQVRWEVFDFLNHPNFGIPENAVNAVNAGTLLSSSTERLMQFGLRYEY